MKVVVVRNGNSGSAVELAELVDKCGRAGITVDHVIDIGPELGADLKPFVDDGANILAIGGDGTVSAVAGHLAHTDATLVPIPGGTLNNFTKDLGIPQDLDEALARAAAAQPRQIDIASVNDIYFVNNSSIGLYSASLRERKLLEKVHSKWPAAVIATVRAFYRFKSYRVRAEGIEFTTPIIFVGNNRYPLGSVLGEVRRERLDEGVLSAFVVATNKRIGLLKVGLHLLTGTPSRASEFTDSYGTEFTLNTKRERVSVSHDGELTRVDAPLTYRIHPEALRVR